MTYEFNYTLAPIGAKTAQIFCDTLAQFFDDEQVQFECYIDPEEEGICFFGAYGTDDEELFKKDTMVFKAMMDYMDFFDKPQDGTVAIDGRIQPASLKAFEESVDQNEYQTVEDSMAMMCGIARDIAENDETEEITDDSECGMVMFAPSMVERVDGDEINDIAAHFLESNPGENVLVVDDEAVDSGEALKMLIMPGMLEAMKR